MKLFPFIRPRTGLYFSTDKFCFGHIQRGLTGLKLGGYREHFLPPGSIRLSPIEQNIASPEHVLSALHSTRSSTQQPHSVAVCLPDLCARTVVLELASLPKNKTDQKALVEWRLQKELNLSPKPRRVSYQLFGAIPSRFSFTRSPSTSVRFLAVTIQNDIIEKYEALCIEAGFIPASMNIAGLAVLNLCRPVMEATVQRHSQEISFVQDTAIFLYIGDWGFSLIVCQEGQPHFVRVKPLKQLSPAIVLPSQALIEDESSGMHPQSEPNENTIGQAPDIFDPPQNQEQATILAQELLGSLQFFFETTTPAGRQTHVYPLFLVGSSQPEIILPRIAETIEQAFPLQKETDVPQVKAFPVFPQNPAVQAKTLSGLTHWTSTTLATVAAGYLPS